MLEQIKSNWNTMEQKIVCSSYSKHKNSVFLPKNSINVVIKKTKNSQTISLYTADILEHLFHLFHFVLMYMYLYMYMYMYLFKKRKGQNAPALFFCKTIFFTVLE